jgi:hypothetical protein
MGFPPFSLLIIMGILSSKPCERIKTNKGSISKRRKNGDI